MSVFAMLVVIEGESEDDAWNTASEAFAATRADEVQFIGTPWPVIPTDAAYETTDCIHQR